MDVAQHEEGEPLDGCEFHDGAHVGFSINQLKRARGGGGEDGIPFLSYP